MEDGALKRRTAVAVSAPDNDGWMTETWTGLDWLWVRLCLNGTLYAEGYGSDRCEATRPPIGIAGSASGWTASNAAFKCAALPTGPSPATSLLIRMYGRCPAPAHATSPLPFIFGISELTARDILNMYDVPSIHPSRWALLLFWGSRTATRLVCTQPAQGQRTDANTTARPGAAVEIDAWPPGVRHLCRICSTDGAWDADTRVVLGMNQDNERHSGAAAESGILLLNQTHGSFKCEMSTIG
ncbi:uncharacterized protein LOC117892565 [Drosophila subobscura]|uniref:uncharacterized protein LOC117892565 n=1 Tax=Drosophila subobscura TaxID=7241 RepID=UPI00155AC615|nr:uncharacterized protein LOC117892565 [Drosophila subobscura]